MSDERTQDVISGRLALWQRSRGYRFGLDALLLATDLPKLKHPERACVLELGAGQGAVGLSIAARQHHRQVMLVERNPSMLALLNENVEHNAARFGEVDVSTHALDVREHRAHLSSHCADLIVCNPPYFPQGHRRESADEERADAHHERHGSLADFLRAAAYLLNHRGFCKLILPPWRLGAFHEAIMGDLKLLSLRFLHAAPGDPAYLMEAVLRRGGGPDLEVRAPLHVRGSDGLYSEEVARRVAGAARCAPPDDAQVQQTRAASDARRGA
jgi:tRNA1Val (adenine37-N6)-methyltransferase